MAWGTNGENVKNALGKADHFNVLQETVCHNAIAPQCHF